MKFNTLAHTHDTKHSAAQHKTHTYTKGTIKTMLYGKTKVEFS
jgi:hypothetical protein